ncbi:hypothetical protein MTO96_016340 [Rhipicephalus appendiculatus]
MRASGSRHRCGQQSTLFLPSRRRSGIAETVAVGSAHFSRGVCVFFFFSEWFTLDHAPRSCTRNRGSYYWRGAGRGGVGGVERLLGNPEACTALALYRVITL